MKAAMKNMSMRRLSGRSVVKMRLIKQAITKSRKGSPSSLGLGASRFPTAASSR